MITLNGFDFMLDGARVGVFTGTPSDRMAVEDTLNSVVEAPDEDTESVVSKLDVNEQITRIDDAVSDLTDELHGEHSTVLQLKSIADELRDLIK